jgi:hypothetical protein
MATVTVTPEPEGDPVPKADDAAFAHGEAVGEFRTHMTECSAKHFAHESREIELESRIAAVEAAAASAANIALLANERAADAQETADEAVEEDEDEPLEDDTTVVEMEMPDIPTEPSEDDKPKPKRGFHLW